jgi:hypothetical protein
VAEVVRVGVLDHTVLDVAALGGIVLDRRITVVRKVHQPFTYPAREN